MGNELYPYKDKIAQKHLDNLRFATSISEKNIDLITLYLEYMDASGSGLSRRGKLAYQMLRICEGVKVNLDELEYFDLQKVLSNFNQYKIRMGRKTKRVDGVQKVVTFKTEKFLSEATKADYRRAIKAFYLWFEDHDERLNSSDDSIRSKARKFYRAVKKIKSRYKSRKIDPSDVITSQDLSLILNKGCLKLKEKAFVSLLHETGSRVGEILSQKVGNFSVDKQGIGTVYFPKSKTDPRPVKIIDSVGYLIRYLEIHPDKDNPDAPLWYKENLRKKEDVEAAKNGLLALRYTGAVKMVKKCVLRSGLKKKCNLHWFRHSRASLDAPILTPDVRCARMGWSQGSNQLQNYTHLSQQQVDNAYLKSKGITIESDGIVENRVCNVCNWPVSEEKKYCPNCFRPMSIKQHLEDQERIKREVDDTAKKMMEMMKDKDFARDFEMYMKLKSEKSG